MHWHPHRRSIVSLPMSEVTALLVNLPPITRRTNARAKRLLLRVRQDGIYLTMPPRVPEPVITQFLRASEAWLLHTWQQMQQAGTDINPLLADGEFLDFLWLLQRWQIVFADVKRLRENEKNYTIYVNEANATDMVKRWVLKRARTALPERLALLAQQYGFNYRSCTLKHVKSRWGSCSSKADIHLNVALMLLPLALLDYVLLHELCHTRQMNHSTAFWLEMQRVDPLYQSHRQQLKQFKMPGWWY